MLPHRLRTTSVIFTFYLAILSLAPLPLGAHRPWSGAIAAVLLGVCALSWSILTLSGQIQHGVSWRRLGVPMGLFSLGLAWGAFQLLPYCPTNWAHPLWLQAEAALPEMPRLISMAPSRGAEKLMQLLAIGLAFLIAVQMGRSTERAKRLVEVLALTSGAIALYGLTVYMIGSETILWMDKWAYQGDLTAVLVNRNHYADLAGLGLLCAVAACVRQWQSQGPRHYLRSLLDGRTFKPLALLLSAAACAMAIPLTHSRAGTVTALFGLLALFSLSRRWQWKQMGWLILLVATMAIPALSILEERMTGLGADSGQRLRVWQLSMGLLEERPWLGHGLGAFPDAFQAVRPETVSQIWTEAHNSWLETMIELGVPAALCLFFATWWVWGRCLAGARHRHRDRIFPALGVSSGLMIGTHALVDFSIQIPAIAFFLAALMGVGFAQSWSSQRGPMIE